MRHGLARKNVIRIAVGIIALLLFFFLSPFGTIAAWERGVHLRSTTAVTGKVFGRRIVFSISTHRVGSDDGCQDPKIRNEVRRRIEGSADSAFRRGTQLSHRRPPEIRSRCVL